MGLSDDPTIRFRAFGTVALEGPDGVDTRSVLARAKLLALLSFLAGATPKGFHRRDTLMGLFWAELDQERARGALRQSLYYLRQFLGEGVVVTRGDDEVGLADERFWSDVAAFDSALARGAREEALALYAGELLRGFYLAGAPEYERWLDERRTELRRHARDAAWALAQLAAADGSAAAAARWVRDAVRFDPLDEAMVRRAIEMLDQAGDRAGALQEYERFARRLHQELEVEPAPETRKLADAVRARTVSAGSSGAVRPNEVDDTQEPTEPTAVRPGPAPAATLPPALIKPLIRSRRFRLGVTVGASLVIALGVLWAFRLSNSEGSAFDPNRVVVAVFENLTGDAALDPVGRMAADWITQGLDQLDVIDVVPSTTGFGSRPDFRSQGSAGSGNPRALAEATGAMIVVAGSFYRSGDSIQFQSQIVDARNGELLSVVVPVGGPRDAIGAIVDTLRQFVVGTVATVFDSRLSSPPPGARPPSLEAYRAYLAGYRAFHSDGRSMREALIFFSRALELDSSFIDARFYVVLAHGNLGERRAADSNAQILSRSRTRMTEAQTQLLDWLLAVSRGDRLAALEAARAGVSRLNLGAAAQEAYHLNEAAAALSGFDEIPEWYFHWIRLMEVYHMLGEYGHELREAERARETFPERSGMLEAEVRALAALGRIDDVTQRLDEILPLLPDAGQSTGLTLTNAAAELRAHGHRAASFEVADRAIYWYQSRPSEEAASGLHRFGLANAFYLRESWRESGTLFEALAADAPRDVNLLGFLGVLAARRGDREAATRVSDGLTGLAAPNDFGRDTYWQACIAAQLGDLDRAMELLRDAYAQGRAYAVALHRDMDLEPLQNYAPFQQFMASRD